MMQESWKNGTCGCFLLAQRQPVLRDQPHFRDCRSRQEFPALYMYRWRSALHYKEVSETLHFFFLFSTFPDLQYERHSINLCDLRMILKNYRSKSLAILSSLSHEHTGLFSTAYSQVLCPTWLKQGKLQRWLCYLLERFWNQFPL